MFLVKQNILSLCFSFHLITAVPRLPLFSVEDEGRENLHSLDVAPDTALSPGDTSLLSPLALSGTSLQQK